MSPIHNTYAVLASLEDEEDGQKMEASPTNSNKEGPMEDLDTAQGDQQSNPASKALQGVRKEKQSTLKMIDFL